MPSITLSAAAVQAIRATPRNKPETFFDEIVTGFVLNARPRGTATYAVRYKNQYGRQREFKIANAADITFAEAKKEAVRIKGLVALGKDPQEKREEDRRIPTVNELSERYLERYAHADKGVLLNAVNAAAKVTGTTWGEPALPAV